MHRIALDGAAKTLSADTKLNNDYDFFEMLRQNGRRAARRFLDEHFDDIGRAQHRRPARGGAGRTGLRPADAVPCYRAALGPQELTGAGQ